MSELELKFQVPKRTVASLQAELRRRGALATRMVACYFDTADGTLARNGLSLRLRSEGRIWVQTLKVEGFGAVDRLEHGVPLGGVSNAAPRLDVARHDGCEAGARLRKALAGADRPELVEQFRTDVVRLACDLQPPGAVLEAAFDLCTIEAGDRSAPICELELEHKSGSRRALFALGSSWRAHGGLWADTRSKFRRGTLLAAGRDHGAAVKAGTPTLDRHMDGSQLLRAMLRSALEQVLANASEVACGSTDEAHVHQLRVGLRRLRTALRELASLDQRIDARWDQPLSDTFARLGEVRDNETVARSVRPLLEEACAPKLEWEPPGPKVDPVATVRDGAFQSSLLDLLAFVLCEERASGGIHPMPHRQALRQIGRRLSKLHRRVVRGGKRFRSLPAEAQHQVRKRLKRLRYLAEFVAPLWKRGDARRYLRHLGPAQDALGAHNDVAVAQDRFRRDAERDPRSLYAAGFLEAHLETTAQAAHAALKLVTNTAPFWKR